MSSLIVVCCVWDVEDMLDIFHSGLSQCALSISSLYCMLNIIVWPEGLMIPGFQNRCTIL